MGDGELNIKENPLFSPQQIVGVWAGYIRVSRSLPPSRRIRASLHLSEW